jgi:hypothetical protein
MAELKSAQMLGVPYLDGKYSAILDMWPLENPENNRIYPFYDNLKQGRWTTTKCKKCGNIDYPPGVVCTSCWSDDLEWVELPKTAKIVAVTEMSGPPTGFEPPLIMAWLGFDKSHPLKHLLVRLINCKLADVKNGDVVKLVVFDVPANPIDVKKETKICERVYYAFEPVKK